MCGSLPALVAYLRHCIAVTSFLVGVQASSISRVQKELDIDESETVESPWILEDLDGTSPNGALDEVLNIITIVDVLNFLRNYKDVMGCSGNTCQWCISPACFKISYLPSSNEFQFCAAYKGNNIFCQSVPVRTRSKIMRTSKARDFKYCKAILDKFNLVTLCIEAMNVRISGGRVCLDVKVSAAGFPYTFRNICLGTSNRFKIA